MHPKVWSENLKVRGHSEDFGTDGRIIIEWILKKQVGKLWIGFIWLKTDQWQEFVNMVMNLHVPLNTGNFLTS